MAKSRRNRRNALARQDPIAKTVKPPSDPQLAALREQKILPVIKDLKSPDAKSRSSAASAISNLIQDTQCRKLLLREQVVHTVLTQTLTDASIESRAAGWGILQVLAQVEEPDFCVHLFRVDVLTAIEYTSKHIVETLLSKENDFTKLHKGEQKAHISITSSVVALLTAMAEAQDDILEVIASNATFVRLLFLLSSDMFASNPDLAALRSDALACLMVLSEDNQQLSKKIITSKNPKCYENLLSLRKQSDSDGVLACGVLHNVFASLQGHEDGFNLDDSILVPTLSHAVSLFQPDQIATNGTSWSSPAEVQQLALEILASIGMTLNDYSSPPSSSSGPETAKEKPTEPKDDEEMMMDDAEGASDDEAAEGEDDEDDDDDDDDDDELDPAELEADMEMVTGVDNEDASTANIEDFPVLKAILQSALPHLIRVASTTATSDDLLRLQGHALGTLNNIAWSVSVIDFSAPQNGPVRAAWLPAARAIWEQVIVPVLASDTADIELATRVTGLAWALARAFHGGDDASPVPLQSDEHRKFMSLYQATKATPAAQDSEDPFQGLGVKCIGVLGQLAHDPASVPLNREIGTFLVTLLAGLPNVPPADAVEALDQLFGMYGNENYACDKEVFWKDNFVHHLDEILPKVRAMVKTIDKRAQGELRQRADEAALNLNRFISYKRKNKPQNM